MPLRRFGFRDGSPLRGVSLTEDAVLAWRDGSALRAGILSFASPKESSQRKGDPRLRGRRCRLPCATRCWRGLRNSALRASNSPRPLSATSSVARRSTWGPGKASRNDGSAQETKTRFFNSRALEIAKNYLYWFGGDAFWVPLRGAEQRRFERKEGEDCLRAKPEFRSPRSNRVAQGTGQRPAPTRGSPFLWLLSFGEAKESTPARKAENSLKTSKNPDCPRQASHKGHAKC
jgi:hypothetical protein